MAPSKSDKGSKKSDGKPVTSDPRFANLHHDPRFRIPKQRLNKQVIDDRFKDRLLNDEAFKRKPMIDKYGRKLETEGAEKELGRYYNLEKEDKEGSGSDESGSESGSEDSDDESGEEDDSDDDEEEASDEEKEESAQVKSSESGEVVDDELSRFRRARGELTDDESSSDDDSSEESEAEELVVEENEIPLGDETKTLAAVNMDWDNIRAVDLMASFSSFVPASGRILSVRIYPSEYGKEKMREESVSGPPKDLFKGKKKDEAEDISESEEEERPLFEEDNGEDVQSEALRKYQIQRLRYYYAVIKCSTLSTARSIYENCDGAEYEATANVFDLRYVPEGTEFEDKPRDECTVVPANYQPSEYATDALRHSKVKLTWDETPAERMKIAARSFSRKEIDNMDVQAYLASDSEDDEDEEDKEAKKNMYKSLISGSEYSSVFDDNGKEEVDMEITFTSGLDEKKQKAKADEGKEETTIEKYKRQMKERRKKHEEKVKTIKSTEDEDDKKTTSKDKKSKGKKTKSNGDDKDTAELELLMAGEEDDRLQHFNMKDIIRAEKAAKRKSKKGKKGKSGADEEATGPEFKLDVEDTRFKALYEDHDFAIDPTKPQFKKTKDMERLMEERRKRTADNYTEENGDEAEKKKKKKSIADEKKSKKRKLEAAAGDKSLSALVDKVKKRAKASK